MAAQAAVAAGDVVLGAEVGPDGSVLDPPADPGRASRGPDRCSSRWTGWSRSSRSPSGAVLQRKIGSVKAVSDVSFSLRKGETFGLVGESGCGKTTIGRLIVALERADSGRIVFDGEDIRRLRGAALRKQAARHAAHVPGPLRLARPPHAGRHHPARAARRPGDRQLRRARREGEVAAERGRV